MQVLLFPTSGKLAYLNYVKTVEYPVDKLKFIDLLEERHQNLFQNSQKNYFSIWGVADGKNNHNLTFWKKSNVGDFCLFYRRKNFFSKGRIFAKIQDEDISIKLWNKGNKGEVWKNLFFIEHLQEIDLPLVKFNKAINYSSDRILRSFQIVSSEQSKKILNLTGEKISSQSREDFFKDRLHTLGNHTDLKIESTKRLEQDILVDYLFGDSVETRCAICSIKYPNQFLVAGHIKKRSLAKPKERKDLNIVMPICKFGCDELFERGYIFVNEKGLICRNKNKVFNRALIAYIKNFIGTKSNYFNKKNYSYFAFHNKFNNNT